MLRFKLSQLPPAVNSLSFHLEKEVNCLLMDHESSQIFHLKIYNQLALI